MVLPISSTFTFTLPSPEMGLTKGLCVIFCRVTSRGMLVAEQRTELENIYLYTAHIGHQSQYNSNVP